MNKIQPLPLSAIESYKEEIFLNKNPSIFVDEESKMVKRLRLHDPHRYVYTCTPSECEEKLKTALFIEKEIMEQSPLKYFDEDEGFLKKYQEEIKTIELKLNGIHALIISFLINISTMHYVADCKA